MGANEAYLVDEVERGRIATFAAYFFYDGMGEMPEEIFEKVGNRSDAHARMVELLSSPEGIDLVTSHMDKALAQLESGEKKLRFRSVMSKEELRAELDKGICPICGGAITVENGYRIHEATRNDYRITRILVDASCHRKLHYSKEVVEPALVIQGL